MNTETELRSDDILRKENQKLKSEILELKKLVLNLQEQLGLNSQNSSISPSADYKKKVQSPPLKRSLGEAYPVIKAAHLNAFLKRK